MLTAEEALQLVGHGAGGVCPFEINANIPVKRFKIIFPASGCSTSAIELTCEELFKFLKHNSYT